MVLTRVKVRELALLNRNELVVTAPATVLLVTSVLVPAMKLPLPAVSGTTLLPDLVAQAAPPLEVNQPPIMPLVRLLLAWTTAPV